ncbi:hypothetical protein AB5L52_37030 [Streptomyces sp. CG4]|uniref:hypothetical protein n=1 Tax=Streptomyces sp. CG4 TaxID=408783 RepID=UPI0034E1BE03
MPGPAETDGNTLVVIDTINAYDHEHAVLPVPAAERAVPVLAEPRGRARKADVLVIYANDGFGTCRSHYGELPERASARPHAGMGTLIATASTRPVPDSPLLPGGIRS